MVICGTTGVYAVIGDPVEHSLSPLMHNRAMKEMGFDAVYVPFRVKRENLEEAVRAMRALDIRGMNVTVPHKTMIIPFLNSLSSEARAVGAVNTIINTGGILAGDNTDVYGFTHCVLDGGDLKEFPPRICIFGAGGAARAVLYACALRSEVSELTILNRTVHKAEKLAGEIGFITGRHISFFASDRESQKKILPDTDMIVNTTTVGMFPNVGISPVIDPEDVFHSGQVVCDIVYNPARTKFLADASEKGAITIGGMAMLAFQGARSLTLWTGREAPVQVMMETLKSALNQETKKE
jgi:shikimate dehydrogenase